MLSAAFTSFEQENKFFQDPEGYRQGLVKKIIERKKDKGDCNDLCWLLALSFQKIAEKIAKSRSNRVCGTDDLVQEGIQKLHNTYLSTDLQKIKKIEHYSCRVLVNCYYNIVLGKSGRIDYLFTASADFPYPSTEDSTRREQEEESQYILNRLFCFLSPEEERRLRCIMLMQQQGRNEGDAASALGMIGSSLKRSKHYAIKKMRRAAEEEGLNFPLN